MLKKFIVKNYSKLPLRMRKLANKYLTRTEGGEWISQSIRIVLKEQFNVEMGIGTYGVIQNLHNNFVGNGSKITIGNYCSIAPNVSWFNANHPYNWASMHPMYYKTSFGFKKLNEIQRSTLTIGHDVWIGAGAYILSGCTRIGNGAVVGAGSVVTKDVESYSIVAGVPAKHIKYRFKNDTILLLEKSCWWELTPSVLNDYSEYIKDPDDYALAIGRRTND